MLLFDHWTSFPFWSAEKNFIPIDAYRPNIHQRAQASVWVSFCEIYNEYVYDLLSVLSTLKNQRRRVLRICEDQGGNSYIKGNNTILWPWQIHRMSLIKSICERSLFADLKWINIQSTEEGCKVLKIGNKNRSFACTRMNEQSSRRFVPLIISMFCLFSFKERRGREVKTSECPLNEPIFNNTLRLSLITLVLLWHSERQLGQVWRGSRTVTVAGVGLLFSAFGQPKWSNHICFECQQNCVVWQVLTTLSGDGCARTSKGKTR